MDRNLRHKQLGHAQGFLDALLGRGKKPAENNNNNNSNANANNNTNVNANANNNSNNNNANNSNANKSQDNPLDIFKDLFKMSSDGSDENASPGFTLDQEALTKVAGRLNFAGQLTPELLDKFKTGDAETIQNVLNTVGQNSYMMLMQHLPHLTEKFVTAREQHSQKGLGKSVKQQLTQQSLAKLAAGNPVLKDQFDSISQRLLEKFPDADPEWLAQKTGEYFVTIAKMVSPDQFKVEGENGDSNGGGQRKDLSDISQRDGFNWGKYLVGTEVGNKPAGNASSDQK